MQEIKYAKQESSARSSPIAGPEEEAKAIFGRAGSVSEDKEDESARGEYRCRVCDGPVERPRFVCEACSRRHEKELEWESYLDFMDGDDSAPDNRDPSAEGRQGRCAASERPVLIVLCGPSHAGKTTFAQRLSDNFMIVNSDEIRRRLSVSFHSARDEDRVWKAFESMKRRALQEGRNVILDACHISKRARWHSLQGPNARHRKMCVVFDLPFRTIRVHWVKDKRMPLKEVERMWRYFQNKKPTARELKREGFDDVYFIRGRCPVRTIQPAWKGGQLKERCYQPIKTMSPFCSTAICP